MSIFSNPIPFIPFPLLRGRGRDFFASPLKEKGKIFSIRAKPLYS